MTACGIVKSFKLILSGNEIDPATCRWCGNKLPLTQKGLPPKNRVYCRHECRDNYMHNFSWEYAPDEALKRSGFRCRKCGVSKKVPENYINRYSNLEVHHKIPLVGRRDWSRYNMQCNLIVLCNDCHIKIHSEMRSKEKDFAKNKN